MPVDACPLCGGQLVVECSVHVSYTVNPGGEDWGRDEVYDDSSEPTRIGCRRCDSVWHDGQFELDDDGLIGRLNIEPEDGDLT